MAHSTADADRIARLTEATRAARAIVEQAKAKDPALVENCQNDRPVRARGHGLPHQPAINQPDP